MRKAQNLVKMTDVWLKNLKPPRERTVWYDTELPCLTLRHGESGSKVFYWYARAAGTMTRLKIGTYPQVSLAEARREAKLLSGDVAAGKSPVSRAVSARDELTLGDLYQWYMRTHAKPHKSTWEADKRRYEQRLMHWDARKLSTITTQMVKDLHIEIGSATGRGKRNGQNGRLLGGPYGANKMLELLGTMWRMGAKQLHFDIPDPTCGIKRFPKQDRERFLNDQEVARFLGVIEAVLEKYQTNKVTTDCILIALFVGGRRSNVVAMRWDQLDLEAGIWHVPSREFKTRKPMAIAIPSVAVNILKDRQSHSTSEWVFPGRGSSGHIVEPKHAMANILREAKLSDVRFHDLRRTLGSWQAAQGTSLHIIGASLGHSSTQSTRIYARLQLDPVRDAVERATAAMKAVKENPEK